ncbi:nucleotidyltransferase family protein [Microbispora sp. NBC_01189]|uniref:nucleotidyltransferase family protein n=1 Tax=Microbispora sp. NBC_01189 TaxID=2903583 RepID=UPI002E11662C|nr:nucleotidyltransferase family protein [Microbispora sp. NBC_01189]
MTDEGIVAGLLLAAGGGSRFGGPKALVEFEGERLAGRGVRLLAEGGCRPVLVVVGAAQAAVEAELRSMVENAAGGVAGNAEVGAEAGAVVVRNELWETGMGSSLRAGLRALPPSAAAVVIALADQPLVRPEAVRRLIAAFRGGARVAVAAYGGVPRNPVLIAREHLAEVAALAVGDVGARPFLRAHPDLVTAVACDDVGDPADVDTPDDLRRLRGGRPAL